MLGDTGTAARDATEAVGILTPIGDSWGLVHAQAMLGGIAQAEHRFDDAADALSRAADESARLGFLGQAALHRAIAGPRAAAAGHQARGRLVRPEPRDRNGRGDGRLAATARLNLARLLRRTGQGAAAMALLRRTPSGSRAGGGDGALLTHCLLAAETNDRDSLEEVLSAARSDENHLVGILALDGLARLSADGGEHGRATELLAQGDAPPPRRCSSARRRRPT